MFIFKTFIVLCLFSIFTCNAKLFDINSFQKTVLTPLNRLKDNIPKTITRKDICITTYRIPKAMMKSMKTASKSFITSSIVLFPVGMVVNAYRPRPFDAWLMRGAATGIEWAKIGAYYAGAEVFISTIRNKDERLNAYLGSGATSAILRFNEGPVGMAKGFLTGYGFMYAIDKFALKKPESLQPQSLQQSSPSDTATTTTIPTINRNTILNNKQQRPTTTSTATSTTSSSDRKGLNFPKFKFPFFN